jgi:hypothetical protein
VPTNRLTDKACRGFSCPGKQETAETLRWPRALPVGQALRREGLADGYRRTAIKTGDKVRFAAIWKDGDYVITRIEVVRRPKAKPP